jgi:hypothetical protein
LIVKAALADERLPPRMLVITLPAMNIAQAERVLEVVDLLSEALWAEYGPAVIDHEARRTPGDDDLTDSGDDPPPR